MAASDRTKRDILRALMELCESGPFEKVSVKAVCDKAGVSRQTFYQHFRDKYDVAIMLQRQILGDNFQQLGKTIGWREAYLNTFREMQRYAPIMSKMQDSPDINSIKPTAVRASQRDFEERYFDRYGEPPTGLIAFQIYWLARIATDVPAVWIDGGCNPPADEFVDSFITLIPHELFEALNV